MLTEIREKAQGFFAWVILLLIGVPFALWGVQNYTGTSGEQPLASVGSKDFFQKEVAQAVAQLSQNYAGMNMPEEAIKAQALQKLISDEVLLQHVEQDGLEITDETARDFVKALPYFQTDGKFDEKQYKAVLSAQNMTSVGFSQRIKQSLKMEQFQRAIMESSFATQVDVDNVFKIQNQQRDVEYLKIEIPKLTTQPAAEEIQAYYQQHQDLFQSPEQVSLEYVELSADELAKKVVATDPQLEAFYQEQKDQYSTHERRKISHILFAINKDASAEQALNKALKAQEDLKTKDFAVVAKEMSDDTLTATKGGDLGLFTPGVMEKDFETAATTLALGAVSAPVKSSFGYHLIKVTELIPGQVKAFAEVKDEVTKAYQKTQSENTFYELSEKLAQLSYENSGALAAVADGLQLKIQKTPLQSKESADGIFSEAKVRLAAFSEEVLNGNNSAPVEMGNNRLVVVRMLEHKPAATQELKAVERKVVTLLLADKAKQQVQQRAAKIQQRLQAGESMATVAMAEQLQVKKLQGITRSTDKLEPQINLAVFKAPKPLDATKSSIVKVDLENGEQAIISVSNVKAGAMSDEDKKKLDVANKNIAKAFGQSVFAAVMKNLEADADVTIKK